MIKTGMNVLKSLTCERPVAVIFLFHAIEKASSSWTGGHRYITPYETFKKQIEFIHKHFTIVSTTELIKSLKNGLQNKEKIASIHFDDGFLSYKEIALPYLKQLKIVSTVFLIHDVLLGEIPKRNKLAYCMNTEARSLLINRMQPFIHELGGRHVNLSKMSTAQFLAWSKNNFNCKLEKCVEEVFKDTWNPEIEKSPFLDLQSALKIKDDPYVEIGSHTLTHSMLSRLSEEQQRKEIIDGHKIFENCFGIESDFFAYPYGGITHFNEISCRIVQESESIIAFSAYGGVNRKCNRTDVKRITLSDQSPFGVKALLANNIVGHE